ncbi:MAG: hypothetical protein QGG89_07775, partial [Vicinamibacterales bacterium]|nr:hypothetical protein [Vicinamibacterales bacterium]
MSDWPTRRPEQGFRGRSANRAPRRSTPPLSGTARGDGSAAVLGLGAKIGDFLLCGTSRQVDQL